MLRCLIAFSLLLSTAAVAAPAWTWVDEQGHRHFSDRPVEGATRIELASPQTYSGVQASAPATQISAGRSSPGQSAAESVAVEYTVLTVVSPESQQTVFNIEGNLATELAIYPQLQNGHRIDAVLDGERVAIGARSTRFTIPEVWRGEHTLQVVVIDQQGAELKRSMPVTFTVRQNSALQPEPQRAQRPIPRPTPQPVRGN